MKLSHLITILALLWGGIDACAQMPQELSSRPEQWQLTLDTIKSKAQQLMVEYNGLQNQYHQLISEQQRLRQLIFNQQFKNDEISRFIKERHGRTDQQLRIEELKQIINAKKIKIKTMEEQYKNLQSKASKLEKKIELLNDMMVALKLHQQAENPKIQNSSYTPAGDSLASLRKQLEDANRQEILLSNELQALRRGGRMQNMNVADINAQNSQLEARLNILRLQKIQQDKVSSDTLLAQASERMINKLKARKDELEAKIAAYEMRMDQLRESSLIGLSWGAKKKRMVHDMVEKDARNNLMREKIKVLHEDIGILRDQVAKLERRMDFIKGKALP